MTATPVALDAYATLDSTTWAALAVVLTVLGLALSWTAWRRRGTAAGIRGLAWSLLPVAAWLTGTLKLVASVAQDVTTWVVHLVFSPVVWTGVALFGVSIGLFLLSSMLRGRGASPEAVDSKRKPAKSVGKRAEPDDVEGMDEIEAILKKHGI